jgi:hypothetical protein
MDDLVDILHDNTAAITNTKELRAHSVVKHILTTLTCHKRLCKGW